MRRRLLSLLMVFTLLLGMMPVTAFAEESSVTATVDEAVEAIEEIYDSLPDQTEKVLTDKTTTSAEIVEEPVEEKPVEEEPVEEEPIEEEPVEEPVEEKPVEEEPVEEEPVEEKPVEEEPVEEEPVEEKPVEEEPVEEEPVEEEPVEEKSVEEEPVVEELPAEGLVEEETSCLSVAADASTGGKIQAGEKFSLKLSDVFADSEGHALTYSFVSTIENQHTKIVDDVFYFSAAAGTYEVTLTAKCEGMEISHKLTITVEAGNAGIAEQYNYNETAADSVKVYVTLSNDGYPVAAKDGTPMSHLEVTVPYFDLALYGMEDYYRYGTANGSGEYINDTVIKRPTGLHLYIYLLERYYMGMDEADCGKGESEPLSYAAETDVLYMDGTEAYSNDGKRALQISGGPTSLYMVNFWGHDENLMYFRNHCYPYMSPGWGSTSDYILLSDGDTWDVAMFSNWEFHNYGYFARFDQDEYTAEAGKSLTVKTQKWGTSAATAGFADVTGLDVGLYTDEWELVEGVEISAAGNSLTFTAPAAGTYYLMAMDPSAKDAKDACIAPATAVLTVTAGTVECETCTDENTDRICDVCGKSLNNLPALAEGVEDRTVLVQTGWAYQVDDLVSGRIFTDADSDSLTYSYRKSSNGGETWGEWMPFGETMEHGTVNKALSNSTAGIYTYEFKANDGFGDSEARWFLTLETRDQVPANVKFYLGQDNNYKDNGNIMPVLELYKTAGLDEDLFDYVGWFQKDGKTEYVYNPQDYTIIDGETDYVVIGEVQYELHDYEKVTFTDSLFGAAPGEGETATPSGTVVNKYNMFYATITTGRYSTRVYGYNTATSAYDIYLGGQSMELPMEVDIYGNGGNDIYLRQIDVYTTSKKLDGTYFTADDYYAEIIMPITGGMIHSGDPYISGNYTKFPFFSWAAGNGSLYNTYVYPKDTDAYIFTQTINNTTPAGTSVVTKSMVINAAIVLKATVPAAGDFGLYMQYNNFNTKKVEPVGEAILNGDGTKTLTYKVSKSNGNYTWRLSDPSGTYVTKAGWLKNANQASEQTFTFSEFTNKASHDFSNLGTAVATRDEADLQVFLSATGFKSVTGTTRVRAYRMWEIIDSDPGNIMVEPDFNIQVLQGNPSDISLVSAGNAVNNWLDVTPTTTDIVAVNYDAVEMVANSGSYGSHGGLFPATNPERTNVFIITNQAAGTAVAHIPFNGSKSTDRGAEWDYNYDTWSYLNTDAQPNLNFTVSAGSNLSVSYAYVITGSDLKSNMSGWNYPTADATGTYNVSLLPFRNAGTKGGTVIIKMTDSTGTSYALVRVAEMAVTVANVSTPGEPFMPGDEISVTFEGLYRSINKISGIFNPTTYYLRYTAGGVESNGALGQYQQMDRTTLKLTIPEDIAFSEGQTSVDYSFTNGYVYGNMYSAASPFQSMYYITDTGVGTNFSAVGTSFVMSRLADIPVTVQKKVVYDTRIQVTDGENALSDYTFTLTDPDGTVLIADENGIYQDLGYGEYSYYLAKIGYVCQYGTLKLGSADAENVVDGTLVKTIVAEKAAEGAWDGTTVTEPAQISGIYQISSGAELAWFAQTVNAGTTNIKGVLTADIDLACYNWTPIGNSNQKFAGSLDGQNHKVCNLTIVNTAATNGVGYGFIGYMNGGSVQNLTLDGNISLTNTASISNGYVGGVIGAATGAVTVTNVHSNVDITVDRVKGNWARVGGLVGSGSTITITNCSNSGDIRGYQYVAGIVAYLNSTGTVTGCYNTGEISGYQYVGGIAASGAPGNVTSCYNIGDVTATNNYVGGIISNCTSTSALSNCFNAGKITFGGTSAYAGAVIGYSNNSKGTNANLYYLEGTYSTGIGKNNNGVDAEAVSAETLASRDFAKAMNTGLETPAYAVGTDHPILTWQDPSAEVLDPNICEHEWIDATCSAPKTCSKCGETEGEADPEAHKYVDGKCEYCQQAEPVPPVPFSQEIKVPSNGNSTWGYVSGLTLSSTDGSLYEAYWSSGSDPFVVDVILGQDTDLDAQITAAFSTAGLRKPTISGETTVTLQDGKGTITVTAVSGVASFYPNTTWTINLTVDDGSAALRPTYEVTLPTETVGYTVTPYNSESPVIGGRSFSFKLAVENTYTKDETFKVLVNGEEITGSGDIYTITDINEAKTVTVEGIREKTLAELNVTVIAPAGSTITSGYHYSYFKYDFSEPLEETVLEDGRIQMVFPPITGRQGFFRVQHPDGVTHWNFDGLTAGSVFEITEEMLFIGSTEFTKDTVYHNFEKIIKDKADLYLTVNEKGWLDMATGDTWNLNVFRNFLSLGNSITNDCVALPDTHYQVIDVNGNPSDVVSVTPDANNSCYAEIKAEKPGTAIILVTYDAVYNNKGEGGAQWSAIWPENTGVIVVTVDSESGDFATNMTVNEEGNAGGKQAIDAEHDILFYTGNKGASFTFKPEDGSTVTVNRSTVGSEMTFSGFTSSGVRTANDGTVTINGLTTGTHIIKVEKDGKAIYQVVRARQVSFELTHSDGTAVTAGNPAQPGETVTVQFHNLVSPLEKLSGVYNANFGFYYNGEDGTAVRTSGGTYGVYTFSGTPALQKFTFTVPTYWNESTYTLTDGAIRLGGFGGSAGSHRTTTYIEGKEVNTNASGTVGILSVLPDILINTAPCGYYSYDATLPTGEGYTVTGGTTPITEGDSYTFTVTIGGGYSGTNMVVKVNGEAVEGTDGTYTVENVREDLVVTVEGVAKLPEADMTTSTAVYTNGVDGSGWGWGSIAYVDTITLGGAEVVSYTWDGETCNVVLSYDTAKNAVVGFAVAYGGRENRIPKMVATLNGSSMTANVPSSVELTDGAATVKLYATFNNEPNFAKTKTFILSVEEAPTDVMESVDSVNTLIEAIQLPVDLEDEEAILAAWEAYNALSEKEQKLVANAEILFEAKAELDALKAIKLTGGKSVTLKTSLTGKVTWSLDKEYEPYASIVASGKSAGKLTARKVLELVSVYAVATDAEGSQETVRVDIYPAVSQVKILDAQGALVNGKTVPVKVNDGSDGTYVFSAGTYPADSMSGVKWSLSAGEKKKVSSYLTYEVSGSQITLKPVENVKKGTVTLTATATDGSGKKASVKLNIAVLAEDVAITGANTVASGKSITLKAAPTNANATSKAIAWSIVEGKEYASISSSGKLTAAKNLMDVKTVKVRATAKDGSGAYGEAEIRITPLALGVQMYNGGRVCSNTKLTQNMTSQDTLNLSARVYPLGKANQAVTWKSSNSKIASIAVDENGKATVTCKKAGKVTITATANDGSKEKATVTLTIVEGIESLTLEDQVIAVKKSLNLAKKIQINPASATNKNLKWKIVGDAYGATISSKGVLNTKKVDVSAGPVELKISATAMDGCGATPAVCTVTVYPATTKAKMTIMHGDAVVGKKDVLELEAGKELVLKGYCEGAANVYTWKSSSKKVQVVDGVVKAAENAVSSKPVTITCTAADGTNVKVSVKVKIVAPKEA